MALSLAQHCPQFSSTEKSASTHLISSARIAASRAEGASACMPRETCTWKPASQKACGNLRAAQGDKGGSGRQGRLRETREAHGDKGGSGQLLHCSMNEGVKYSIAERAWHQSCCPPGWCPVAPAVPAWLQAGTPPGGGPRLARCPSSSGPGAAGRSHSSAPRCRRHRTCTGAA